MPCEQWYKHLDGYQRAVKSYNQAVGDLGGPDFSLAWQDAEAALKRCGAARAVLMVHDLQHACTAAGWEEDELILGDQGQSGG